MASTIKIKAVVSDGIVQVKSLMLHPMETGSRVDTETGQLVAAKYITQLTFTNNDRLVMVANFSTAVSRDPYFSFKFEGGKIGDVLKVVWVDNTGGSDAFETELV